MRDSEGPGSAVPSRRCLRAGPGFRKAALGKAGREQPDVPVCTLYSQRIRSPANPNVLFLPSLLRSSPADPLTSPRSERPLFSHSTGRLAGQPSTFCTLKFKNKILNS